MNRLIALALFAPALGCAAIKPIGPLAAGADTRPAKGPLDSTAAVLPTKEAAATILEEGPRPPRPAYEVTTGEVNDANAAECAAKLRKELDADRKSADAIPRYAEVSRPKR